MTRMKRLKQTTWTFLQGIFGEATFLFYGLEFSSAQAGLSQRVVGRVSGTQTRFHALFITNTNFVHFPVGYTKNR